MKNKTKIEQIVKLYKENFPMGWLDRFEWNDEHSVSSLESVREKMNSFEQEMFYLFAQSVLSGEYILRPGFHNTSDDLFELLSNGEIFDDENNQLKTAAIQDFNKMTYELSGVIRRFRYLLTMLINKYEERQTKYIVNAYRLKHEIESREGYGRLYDVLIEVTKIDHFLSYDKRTITDLIIYHTELLEAIEDKNLQEKTKLALDILNEKCLFLLKKLLIDDNKMFDYMIDFKHKHYDTSKLTFKYFSDMDKKFEFYRAESYLNEPMGYQLDVKSRKGELAIGQYTLLMKYYKDSADTRIPQIDNILNEFIQSYERLSAVFVKRPLDRYGLGTLKNYMCNCRFSFILKDSTCTFKQLQEGLNDIMDIQLQTGILNFYPYRKAFQKAIELLRANESLEKKQLEEYNKFIQLCISKFSEAINWSRTNCFYPIQNIYNECLVPVVGFGAVFVASSFCRPVRYDKLKDELNTFKSQALLMDNEIALREEKRALKNLKKDIDNSRTKEVEVLSFFTAIITFLFGTIGFFADNKNNDFLHLIFSIFGLGAILLIFVSGIHLTTMRKEEKVADYFKHPRAWFCIFTIIASAGLLVWLLCKVDALKTM